MNMNHVTCCGLLLVAACASPRAVGRSAPVPLGEPVPVVDVSKEQGTRAAADRSAPTPMGEAAMPMAPAGGGDTGVSFRTVTQFVEVPAAPVATAPAPTGSQGTWSSGYASGYTNDYPYGYAYYAPRRYREPWFPINTVVGLGVGSAIDHHRWHHGRHGHRGAWIGGGVGLLLDLHRLWR